MKTVVIGMLGTSLDAGEKESRWDRWRPTISLAQHSKLGMDRLELIYQPTFRELADLVVADIRKVSPQTEVNLHSVEWEDPWDFEEVYGYLHDFCQGYAFNNDEEHYLIHLTTGTHVAQICSFLLTESRHLPGRLIQTSPPMEGSPLPGRYTIIDLDLSRYDSIAARFQQQADKGLEFLKGGIATRNAGFNAMIAEIEQVAINSHSPILLMGPTGSGKTQLARRIYALKKARKQVTGELVTVNCGTLRGDAAMATLFGHTRGAFTGASADRAGLLKAADEGLLFLDEVGELGLDEQAMLLHAIEEKRFRPLGSDVEEASDFQLIAGTNRDLREHVRKGSFREDLLARINLWSYRLPSLADRREDIQPNIRYECLRFEEQHGRKIRFNREAEEAYLRFAMSPEATWKGNFRDLNSSITRMATLAGNHRINQEHVEREIVRLKSDWQEHTAKANLAQDLVGLSRWPEIDYFDQLQLAQILPVCKDSRTLSEAGRKLFNISRQQKASRNDADRLKKYLARFGLTWADVVGTSY